MEFQPLTPEEISNIDPFHALAERVNYQTRHVISAFVSRKKHLTKARELAKKVEQLEEAHQEMSIVPEPNRPPEWITDMAHYTKELNKARLAEQEALASEEIERIVIQAVHRELVNINEMHPSAWHTTQALLDTIEMGLSKPFHPLWK